MKTFEQTVKEIDPEAFMTIREWRIAKAFHTAALDAAIAEIKSSTIFNDFPGTMMSLICRIEEGKAE